LPITFVRSWLRFFTGPLTGSAVDGPPHAYEGVAMDVSVWRINITEPVRQRVVADPERKTDGEVSGASNDSNMRRAWYSAYATVCNAQIGRGSRYRQRGDDHRNEFGSSQQTYHGILRHPAISLSFRWTGLFRPADAMKEAAEHAGKIGFAFLRRA
jgi:hypothetical protein